MEPIHVVGGGMAGSEAAWQIANMGFPVTIHEMRPKIKTSVHQTPYLAELVCSNSFRSNDDQFNAVGLLHWEMTKLNSLIMLAAKKFKIPAGGALAVDRNEFSKFVTNKLEQHPLVTISRKEVKTIIDVKFKRVIVASGPLTSKELVSSIINITGQDNLAFFDAIAPIVYAESVDTSKTWFQSRYDKGETTEEQTAYLNCALNKTQYYQFIDQIKNANLTEFRSWEKDAPYFNGCLPIETMVERGDETLRFGPMKPVGLTNPHQPNIKPFAVVQLRKENAMATLFNIVGFQTKMKYSNQINAFRVIPGLEKARFARLGGIHKNVFINSPKLLNKKLQLAQHPNISFAGQILGVEGYVESAAMGLIVGRFVASEALGHAIKMPPTTTAIGALISYLLDNTTKSFQPMNVNFGLFPPIETALPGRRERKNRYKFYTDRAKVDMDIWINNQK